MTPKRALLCSYWFPPAGGSGVQRATKLARYLPEFGWNVDVLTVKDVSYYAYDPALLGQLPASVRVVRAGSTDPGRLHRIVTGGRRGDSPRPVVASSSAVGFYRSVIRAALVPDPQILWVPFARRAGRKLRPDAIISTSPPMSSHLVAASLAKRLCVPFVADFRDAWTQDPYLRMPTALHRALQRRLERSVLRRADRIVAISERIRHEFLVSNPWLPPDRAAVIPNGFDPADFEGVSPTPGNRPRIAYVGSLHAHHREPLRLFLDAFRVARGREGGFAARAQVRFIGAVDRSLDDLLTAPDLRADIVRVGYLPHREAIAEALGADLLLLLVDTAPGNETTVTGKVFDYLGARRPLVLVGPEGDAAEVVREAGGAVFGVGSSEGLADYLREVPRSPDPVSAQKYSRLTHARRFAELLDEFAGG